MVEHDTEPKRPFKDRALEFTKKHWRAVVIPGTLAGAYFGGIYLKFEPVNIVLDHIPGHERHVTGTVENKGTQAATDKSVEPVVCTNTERFCPVDSTSFQKPARNLLVISRCEEHGVHGGSQVKICNKFEVFEVDDDTFNKAKEDENIVLPSNAKKVELNINP